MNALPRGRAFFCVYRIRAVDKKYFQDGKHQANGPSCAIETKRRKINLLVSVLNILVLISLSLSLRSTVNFENIKPHIICQAMKN